MSRLFNPFIQVEDANGNPLAGAKLNTYFTGTSSRKQTFTDSTMGIAHANPIIANANGMFPQIFGTGLYKLVLTDANDVLVATYDRVSIDGLEDYTGVVDYFVGDGTTNIFTLHPTVGDLTTPAALIFSMDASLLSPDTYELPGNGTVVFQDAPPQYARVTYRSAAIGATGQSGSVTIGTTTTGAPGTSATVTNTGTAEAAILNFTIPRGDKGDTGNTGPAGPTGPQGPPGPGDVNGPASATNNAVALFDGTTGKLLKDGGLLGTMASQAANNVNITGGSIAGITDLAVADGGTGASSASAARSNLGAAASGVITSSGLTMTTSRLLGRTTASTGAVEEITVGSGLSLSGGTLSASGGAAPGSVLIAIATASNSASLDFTGLSSDYGGYVIELDCLSPASQSFIRLDVQVSGSWQATTYLLSSQAILSSNSSSLETSASATSINISGGNDVRGSTGALSGVLRFPDLSRTSARKPMSFAVSFMDASNRLVCNVGSGVWDGGDGAVTGLRLRAGSGNLSSGTARLYGLRKTV